MDGSLSHFKATLQRRKERQEKNNGKFRKRVLPPQSHNSNSQYDFPELSVPELGHIKLNIKKKIKANNPRQWFLSILKLFMVPILISLLF